MTLERWYHRAAVVIWPRSKHFHVLCSAGTDASIGALEPLVKRLQRATKAQREEQHRECLAFASAILDSWQPGHRGYPSDKTDRVDRNVFPDLLCQLGEAELVRRFLVKVLPADGTVQVGKSFVKFCQQQGWASFEAELATVLETMTAATVTRNAELLQALCVSRDKNAERIGLCRRQSPHAGMYENHGLVRSGLQDLRPGPEEPVPARCAGAEEGLAEDFPFGTPRYCSGRLPVPVYAGRTRIGAVPKTALSHRFLML